MRRNIERLALLTMASALLSPTTTAQQSTGQQIATGQSTTRRGATPFAEPVLLHAGDKLLGQGRLYPSPVSHDIDGDGRLDVVVGDLRGHLTFALGLPGAETSYGNEQKLMDAEGKVLDFGNW